jgi:hypothetical protein
MLFIVIMKSFNTCTKLLLNIGKLKYNIRSAIYYVDNIHYDIYTYYKTDNDFNLFL